MLNIKESKSKESEMRTLTKAGLMLFALVALLGLGSMVASAQGPVANLTPMNVPYIDNQAHPIPAGGSLWFSFNYTVSPDTAVRPVTTLTLVNGNASGVTFDVWTPLAAMDTANNAPIGRASTFNVDSDAGMVQSSDLNWVGAFGGSGTYLVRVMNTNMSENTAKLTISGDGVSLAPIAVTGPAASAQPGPNTDDPARAVAIDGKQQTIPANSTQWYSFAYTINSDGTANVHSTVEIQLVNGNMSGLSFEVFSPENIGDWWENTPTGAGSPMMVPGDDGSLTQSANLNWSGAFGASGTYFVRVRNGNPTATPVTLMLSWPN
jgi:hypothetical protein